MVQITIPPIITIPTPRLLLREVTLSDVPAVFAYATRPEVTAYTEWSPPASPYDTEELIQRWVAWQFDAPRSQMVLAITLPAEGRRLIGTIGLTMPDSQKPEAELGYSLDSAYWGRGLATEAAAAMMRYGFRHAAWERIFATCDVKNAASIRVLEKIGMQQEGLLPNHFINNHGEWRDSLLFAIYP